MRYRTKRRRRNKISTLPRHLAGIRFRINTSACGNAIKILHPRKRRFCNHFGSQSPRAASADAHKNLHSPLAGRLRSESSACGNAIKILHPRKRRFCNYGSWSPQAEMHIKIYILPSREYDPESTLPLAEIQSKYCIPASGDSRPWASQAEMHINICIPPPLAGIRPRTGSSACGNAIKILHSRERRFSNNSRPYALQAEMHV